MLYGKFVISQHTQIVILNINMVHVFLDLHMDSSYELLKMKKELS